MRESCHLQRSFAIRGWVGLVSGEVFVHENERPLITCGAELAFRKDD